MKNKKTPATTIDLLCKRALTGVGPSIAEVSQGWKKNWADFPIILKKKQIINN